MGNPLERYYSILEGKERALYLLLRHHPVKFDSSWSDDDLRSLHAEHVREFRSFLRGVNTRNEEVATARPNLLDLKVELANRSLGRCEICEWRCQADRANGERGKCGVLDSRISSDFLHYGEEPPLIPSYTIFFSGCNFRCVFCQNFDISTNASGGMKIPPQLLAQRIAKKFGPGAESEIHRTFGGRRLLGAVNVNWVGGDPTPNLAYILEVLRHSSTNLPQVWNSNMYLTERSMELLNGVVDVFLTDFKYGSDSCAKRLSGAQNYVEVVSRNHLLAAGQAEVMVRHLVMPNHVECCSKPVLRWIAENIPNSLVNVMDQYRPVHRAFEHKDIGRGLKASEFDEAHSFAKEIGLSLV